MDNSLKGKLYKIHRTLQILSPAFAVLVVFLIMSKSAALEPFAYVLLISALLYLIYANFIVHMAMKQGFEAESGGNFERAALFYADAFFFTFSASRRMLLKNKITKLWEAHGPFYFEKTFNQVRLDSDNDKNAVLTIMAGINIIIELIAGKKKGQASMAAIFDSPEEGMSIKGYVENELAARKK